MSGNSPRIDVRKTGLSGTASFFGVAGTPAEVLFASCEVHIGPIRYCFDRITGDRHLRFGGDHDRYRQASLNCFSSQDIVENRPTFSAKPAPGKD